MRQGRRSRTFHSLLEYFNHPCRRPSPFSQDGGAP